MIKATYTTETGDELEVEIIDTGLVRGTAMVVSTGAEEVSALCVDQYRLSNIRVTCSSCGLEFDPAGVCSCGHDWRPAVTDEQDGLDTQAELANLYRGG